MSRMFSHSPMNFNIMSPAIKVLIAANIAGFALAQFVPDFNNIFGLVPAKVVNDRHVWQLVTYLFLHGDFFHLFLNLFSLWMFALPVESQWGSKEFVKYYFLCGIGAGIISVAIDPTSTGRIIGASGAIFGLLVAFAMLYPDAVVYLYALFPVKARHMAIAFGVLEFFAGISHRTPGVARFAHLGGMVIGYLYIRWWWIFKIKLKGLWYEIAPRGMSSGGRPRGGPLMLKKEKPQRSAASATAVADEHMMEVDRILDKISEQGQSSLSQEELDILKRHAERKRPEGNA